ncbi:MAG: hypothetical protein GC159_13125 [Phycisphaera sp.]|nr:hypothetical protein [Phycisphaera sp.]
MSFPPTRHTLIQRLVDRGGEADWRQFLADYWVPLCLFAERYGRLSAADAEDVAAATFEVLLRKRLLEQWASDPSAKLRTLLCAVGKHVMGTRLRTDTRRKDLMREHGRSLTDRDDLPTIKASDATDGEVDVFYGAWIEALLHNAVEGLMRSLHEQNKGDYFRVLYGRVCEGLTMRQISEALGVKLASVENYDKAVRRDLTRALESQMRQHVERYTPDKQVADEYRREWDRLGVYLKAHGGVEQVVRHVYASASPDDDPFVRDDAIQQTIDRFTDIIHQSE